MPSTGKNLHCDKKTDVVVPWSKIRTADSRERIDRLFMEVLEARIRDTRRRGCALRVLPGGTSDGTYVISRQPKVFFQLRGANVMISPSASVSVGAGEVGIIPARCPHREHRDLDRGRYAHIFLTAAPDAVLYSFYRITSISGKWDVKHLLPERQLSSHAALVASAASALAGKTDSGSSASSVVQEGLLLTLLGAIQAIVQGVSSKEQQSLPVRRCKQIVEERLLDHNLTVASIADELRLHPDYLSRVFSREERMRLNAYINEARVQAAKRRLMQTDASVTEVAEKVGYTDRAYFAKVFRDIAGCSPTVYRKYSHVG